MAKYLIQKIFQQSFPEYAASNKLSNAQFKASNAILKCKSGKLGSNTSICSECGYTEIHYNSCRNRHCPNCQAVSKEIWVDARSAEVIDTPYFHLVFTLPHELNPLLYANQKILYQLLHKCSAETILELSEDKQYLGATPGIIQVLHTWNQELNYHVHMHCIVSGGGLTPDRKLIVSSNKFFIPIRVLNKKFKGKFMSHLKRLYSSNKLVFSSRCKEEGMESDWENFCNELYNKEWCPYIKETFNGFGNAIEYLGRYTHKIAISNSRINSVSETTTTFSARGIKPGDPRRTISIPNSEFIRRFLLHVLPDGFQRMRYYGFLNNRMKRVNLTLIFQLQGKQLFTRKFINLSKAEIIKLVWNHDICKCPACGSSAMSVTKRSVRASP